MVVQEEMTFDLLELKKKKKKKGKNAVRLQTTLGRVAAKKRRVTRTRDPAGKGKRRKNLFFLRFERRKSFLLRKKKGGEKTPVSFLPLRRGRNRRASSR